MDAWSSTDVYVQAVIDAINAASSVLADAIKRSSGARLIDWLQLGATAVVGAFTAVYVVLTRRLLRTSEQVRRDALTPVLVFRYRPARHVQPPLRPGDPSVEVAEWRDRIVNISQTPALEIRMRWNVKITAGQRQIGGNLVENALAAGRSIGPSVGDPLLDIEFYDQTGPGRTILGSPGLHMMLYYRNVLGEWFATEFFNSDSLFLGRQKEKEIPPRPHPQTTPEPTASSQSPESTTVTAVKSIPPATGMGTHYGG
jgi:hypothetical protein